MERKERETVLDFSLAIGVDLEVQFEPEATAQVRLEGMLYRRIIRN